jgi:hypothetical protein
MNIEDITRISKRDMEASQPIVIKFKIPQQRQNNILNSDGLEDQLEEIMEGSELESDNAGNYSGTESLIQQVFNQTQEEEQFEDGYISDFDPYD